MDPLREHLMRDAPERGREIYDLAKDAGVELKWDLLRLAPWAARKRAALAIGVAVLEDRK